MAKTPSASSGRSACTSVTASANATVPAEPSPEELKGTHRATWAAGDYAAVAEHIDEMPPRDLLALMDIGPGQDVLDVATGTGNAALRAAAGGAPSSAST